EMLEDGSMNLTTVASLAAHVTAENCATVLSAARGKSKREVEKLIARLDPRPDVPSDIRKLPIVRPSEPPAPQHAVGCLPVGDGAPDSAPVSPESTVKAPSLPRRPRVAPLAPERYRVQFTVSEETLAKLKRVQELLGHQMPSGDLPAIFDRALTAL